MRFHVVMLKTMGDLMGLRRTVGLIAGGLLLPVFMCLVDWQETFRSGTMSLDMQTSFLAGYFVLITFLWMAGFYLAYLLVGTSGLGLIDREKEKGTLLLMVSKPISRTQFLLGKFLALVLTTLLLEAIILVGSVIVFWIMLGLDPDTVSALLELLPWMLLFSLLVTLVFASLSVALSALGGSDVARSIAFLALLVFVFAAGPVMRMNYPDIYKDYYLYYLDGGYNLSNAYVLLLDQVETDRLTPQAQAYLGIATGAYQSAAEVLMAELMGGGGVTDPEIGAMPPSLERTTHIIPGVSIGLILAIAAAGFWSARMAFNRKEVQSGEASLEELGRLSPG